MNGHGRRYDAVVVGSGPNGLVAANHLVDAGWSVLVLEAQPDVGGAVRSADDVHPGFVHDTFSAFYPLGSASPAIRALGLEQHGLRWRHAPAVLGHPTPEGQWALLHRDRGVFADRMQDRIEALAPGFSSRILARRVLGPRELESRDANLLGGALDGGTASLDQQLVFRPVPGLGRAETPIAGLFLGSSSAHPGGGVHGAPGRNAARAALAHARLARLSDLRPRPRPRLQENR